MADIQRYLDGIESQHQKSPRYMSMVAALLEKVDDVHQVIADMPRQFSIDDAVGKQLDVLGRMVGIDRRHAYDLSSSTPDLLDDDAYRTVQRTTIVGNQWDGTVASFIKIWKETIPEGINADFIDNQDMSITIEVYGQIDPTLLVMLGRGEYLPKPEGVAVNVTVLPLQDEATAETHLLTNVSGIYCRREGFARLR